MRIHRIAKSKYINFRNISEIVTYLLTHNNILFSKVEDMNGLFCDCCGKEVKAVYPCKFVYHDNLICEFNICLDCMEQGTLKINLKRKRIVTQNLAKICKHQQLTQ